jgi:CheY-like chemotaxis protein
MTKPDFVSFKVQLQKTLHNLYNPAYQPDDAIFEVTGCSPAQGLDCVRSVILEAIEGIGAGNALPAESKSRFDYKLLVYRYMELQSQEQASELLDISPRHLRRKQQEAIVALALKLWQKHFPPAQLQQDQIAEKQGSVAVTRTDTFLHEIEILNASSPSATANLAKVVQKAVEMMAHVLNGGQFGINVFEIAPELEISLHPTVLRQVILYTIECISQSGYAGAIDISARSEAGSVVISFSTCEAKEPRLLSQVNELVDALGARIKIRFDQNGCTMDLYFPRTEKVHLLVVDDNIELVGLYRRYVANTRYEVIHLPSGSDLLDQIRIIQPDVIVMDILLPELDGWDLLLQIHQSNPHPSIPVVICSVIGSEHMARSMGASGYLTKPVERKTFIEMLDRVCGVRHDRPERVEG